MAAIIPTVLIDVGIGLVLCLGRFLVARLYFQVRGVSSVQPVP